MGRSGLAIDLLRGISSSSAFKAAARQAQRRRRLVAASWLLVDARGLCHRGHGLAALGVLPEHVGGQRPRRPRADHRRVHRCWLRHSRLYWHLHGKEGELAPVARKRALSVGVMYLAVTRRSSHSSPGRSSGQDRLDVRALDSRAELIAEGRTRPPPRASPCSSTCGRRPATTARSTTRCSSKRRRAAGEVLADQVPIKVDLTERRASGPARRAGHSQA